MAAPGRRVVVMVAMNQGSSHICHPVILPKENLDHISLTSKEESPVLLGKLQLALGPCAVYAP